MANVLTKIERKAQNTFNLNKRIPAEYNMFSEKQMALLNEKLKQGLSCGSQ